MLRLIRAVTLVLLVVLAGLIPRPAFASSILVVDDDGRATASDCNANRRAFSSIHQAVNAASPGDTVFICPGTFDEQVTVTTPNLTILGSGMGSTTLRPSAVSVNTSSPTQSFDGAVILLVDGVTGVTVKDLAIDGGLADGGAATPDCRVAGFYAGIYYRLSSGTVDATHVTNMRSGTRCAGAVWAGSNFDRATHLEVTGSRFDNYGTEGLHCLGPNTSCIVTGNTFSGLGPVSDQLQGGIIFRLGAGGQISNNIIADHFYVPAVGIWEFSVGIALFLSEPGVNGQLLQMNTFSGNQHDVQRQQTAEVYE